MNCDMLEKSSFQCMTQICVKSGKSFQFSGASFLFETLYMQQFLKNVLSVLKLFELRKTTIQSWAVLFNLSIFWSEISSSCENFCKIFIFYLSLFFQMTNQEAFANFQAAVFEFAFSWNLFQGKIDKSSS